MSISEQEQQVLKSIEDDLARAGPELALKLGIFERLTSGEEMPSRERLWRPARAPAVRASAAPPPEPGSGTGPLRAPQALRKPVTWQLLWLVLTVTLLALALAFSHGAGKNACTVSWAAACGVAHASAPG
ncbi:MAG TPA: hypothetical protein VFQ68_11575 [Streptosporangiaceae bacterium]|nr:hypothetical protein [Streptosporangiaceae bacterium]